MISEGELPFDALATDYDHQFSTTSIGRRMRVAVQRRLDASFRAGQLVLELNCGTGEDAAHLARRGVRVVATDASGEMIRVAQEKIARLALDGLVHFARLDLEDPTFDGLSAEPYDGVVSNFGGLNCIRDLRPLAGRLSAVVKPGGRVVACIMGPTVPWEWLWFSLRGQFGKAFRRLRPGGVPWRGLQIHYPTIATVRRAFSPHFRCRRVSGVGVFIPPTYAEQWAARHPRLLEAADRWERRVAGTFPFPWLADHYLLELERVSAGAPHAKTAESSPGL